MSSSVGSGSRSSSEVESDDDDVFPDDFPVEYWVYDQYQLNGSQLPLSVQANPHDPRRREFNSLYPLDWLTADPTANSAGATAYLFAPIGRLRTKWRDAFQQDSNGEWNYVEYVPAWSDPDWNNRYTYTRDAAESNMDQIARQYAKPGMLQTQRPAIGPNDAYLRPTEAAKRWGVYPWHTQDDLDGLASPKGWSGVTPCMPGFPIVELNQPHFSPDAGRVVDAVTVDDLASERQRLEQWRRLQGLETTDEDFRQSLRDVSLNPAAGPVRTEKAAALLVILDFVQKEEEKEAYQRLLFGGNTSNELVEQDAWTLGADASTDLANPLHDLILRSKWARTESWGSHEDKPRVVYNLSGKQGEYTAHDETLWNALQPALQLVTQILNSQHPATWIWADIRKLRPIEDSRGSTRSTRFWKFSVSPDHDVDVANLTGLASTWPDFVDICASGFDTTGYACEILKRTIEWDIKSNWRISSEADNGAKVTSSSRSYGATIVDRKRASSSQTPFKIRISIAADLIWPLLVDEYSPAEKAAATMFLATTMLHELSHALVVARSQMFMPGTCKHGDEPLWLLLDRSWRQNIASFNRQHSVDILDALQNFGARMRCQESSFADHEIFWPQDEVYWQTEPDAEEGWATENQYFGGIFEALPAASYNALPEFEHFRFLEESTFIAALRGWETDSGYEGRFQLFNALAMSEYQKMYSQRWWNSEFVAYGPAAMKIYNTKSPVRAIANMSILHVKTLWALAGKRYGDDARDWLRTVWKRMKEDTEHQFLWRYLFYQTLMATEAEASQHIWFIMHKYWGIADIAVWNDRSAVNARAAELETALDNNTDRNTDIVYEWGAARPVAEFRRMSVALWHMQSVLSREATYFQNLAVSFITLDDRAAKHELSQLYSERITTRLTDLYIKSCDDLNQILDGFNDLGTRCPNITSWLVSDPDIAYMWNRNAFESRDRLRIIIQFFNVALGVFSDDPTQRTLAVNQMGTVPSGAAHKLADRIKRIAMREYHTLAPTDPRKKTADEWGEILRNGDLLRNPPPNSPAANFNQQLHGRVVNINEGVAAHQRAVANSHPDPQGPRHIADNPALLNQQPPTAGSVNHTRNFAVDQQAAFGAATGFQPYTDPTTGFTRFADMRAYQPSLGHFQQTTPMAPQQQNQQHPGAYFTPLEHRIEHTAAQLQQMSQPQGQPFDMASPAPNIFGAAAAQQGQAMQQIESLLEQRAATQDPVQRGDDFGQYPAP